MVKANVDKILEYMADKKSVSVSELAKKLSLKKDDVMKSAEYLEQDGVVKLDRKFSKTVLTLAKEPEGEKKEDMPQPPSPVPPMPTQAPQEDTLSTPPVQEQPPQPQQQPAEQPKWPEPEKPVEPLQEEIKPEEPSLPEPPAKEIKPPEEAEPVEEEKPKEELKPELKEEDLKQEIKDKLEETKQSQTEPLKEEPTDEVKPSELPETKPPEPVQDIKQQEIPKPDIDSPSPEQEKEPIVTPEEHVVELKEPEPGEEVKVKTEWSEPEKETEETIPEPTWNQGHFFSSGMRMPKYLRSIPCPALTRPGALRIAASISWGLNSITRAVSRQ